MEPNFEDLDLVVDQAVDEKVDIDQADPHSNNIHVAHNNPKNRWKQWHLHNSRVIHDSNSYFVWYKYFQWYKDNSEQPI